MTTTRLGLSRDSGWPLHHIALGAADIGEGAKWLAKRTSVEARLLPPETGQWYCSTIRNATPVSRTGSRRMNEPACYRRPLMRRAQSGRKNVRRMLHTQPPAKPMAK